MPTPDSPQDPVYVLEDREIHRIALLTNPAAGHGDAPHATERAMVRFQERGVDVVAIQGSSPEHARELARTMVADDRIDALVVVGGDGMIRLGLQEQAGSGKPLGIIPAGTGNDHAREYHLPRQNPEAAADVVADGFCVGTDLGRITHGDGETEWFGTIMAAGFDSLVSDRVNVMTWPHGRMRYNAAILVEFLNFHALPFRIEFEGGPDGGLVLDRKVTLAAFGNTCSYGGGMLICPEANHRDGLLDVTVVEHAGRLKAAMSFGRIFKGTHIELPEVNTYRARRATVHCEGIRAYADGDPVAALPVTVEVVPAAGLYLAPHP